MTDNTQELNEILTKLENAVALNIGSQGMRGEAPKRSHWKAKQAIIDWHNKQVEEALDRLEKQNTIFKIHTYNERGVKHTATAGEGVPLSAIEAERNKLKEMIHG